MNLKSLPKHFKKDKEIVLAAVRNDGFAIADADSKFLDDKEIAIEAVKNNKHTLLLLSKRLTEDKYFLQRHGMIGSMCKILYNLRVDDFVFNNLGIPFPYMKLSIFHKK